MRRKMAWLSVSVLSLAVVGASIALAGPGSGKSGGYSYHASAPYKACATGEQEVPPPGVDTLGRAEVAVAFDAGLTQAKVWAKIEGLGTITGAHFHCKGGGLNGPVAFGLLNPGVCDLLPGNKIKCTLTNADWTGEDCVPEIGQPVNNIAALQAAMDAGLIYFNVHTETFPGGEIRGQIGSGNGGSCFGDDDEDSDE